MVKSIKSYRLNIKIAVIVLFVIFNYRTSIEACTSFVVYGSKIYYGMNFDYPDSEILFTISHTSDFKIFQAYFIQNGDTSTICGMNSGGMFSSMQMLYPELTSWPAQMPGQLNLYEAYSYVLSKSTDLQAVIDYLNLFKIKIVHNQGITLHDFFADKNGTAYVLEVGETDNLITPVENNFLVMTNFSNYDFIGKPLDQINGVGADRYKTAYQYIEANKDTFGFDNGIETLHRTIQSSGDFKTQVSFLFDPVNNEIYIILQRDFTRIWKVSIENETVETYSGFNQFVQLPIPATGISSSELLTATSIQNNSSPLPDKFVLYQNYPNPFNPETNISYQISDFSQVSLKIYDALGREVAALVNEFQRPGKYAVQLSAFDYRLTSGVYFYRLKVYAPGSAGSFIDTKKFVLLK